MRESAFVEPPWLLEREGAGYIQVTRLLYEVAEQCTGQSNVDGIAEHVSVAEGRHVSADNVRYLLAKCLVPMGVVVGLDGTAVDPANIGAPSPLRLNLRTRVLSPRVIDPVARLFSRLYWPPVLVLALCAAGVGEGWLYLVHGISGGLHDLLYTPALMLVVLAGIVVSAAFHELGHAAALTFGGGRVKGMGFGLYLVYPAFYTDVSDNYRLGRWARVRTDLGGFYFNVLVAIGLLGVYALTGREVLLLVIVLINLEILHQLFPFVRLDGYWALADVTGLPDFFRYMGAFVATIVPIGRGRRASLPPLKLWARIIFTIYILIAVPLLGILLFLMVRGFPRILATALDSLHQQSIAFVQAQAAGDGLGLGIAVLQIVLLALPVAGLVLTLWGLARRAFAILLEWSKPTFFRRVIASFAVAASAAILVLLWAPQLPLANSSGLLYGQLSFERIRPYARDLATAVKTNTPSRP